MNRATPEKYENKIVKSSKLTKKLFNHKITIFSIILSFYIAKFTEWIDIRAFA